MSQTPKKNYFFKNHDGSTNLHAASTFISALIAAGVLGMNIVEGITDIEHMLFYPAFVVFLGERFGALLNNTDMSNKMFIASEKMKASQEAYSKEILSNIKGSSGVVKFDSLDDAVTSIYRDIASASEVKNLFIGDRDQEKSLGAQRLNPEQLYRKFLRGKNAREWRDVVGISEIYSERYLKLNLKNTKAKLTIKILRHSPPLINFIILKYPMKNGIKNFREVYFGWIGGIDVDETFFYSCDKDLVALFESECNILADTYGWSNEPEDAQVKASGDLSFVDVTSGIDLVDKAGWWITCAKEGANVNRYGVFKVIFEGTGTRIKGRIFDENQNYLNKIRHTKAISHYKDRVHFEYVEENTVDGKVRGTCGYQFHFVGDQPNLSGFVTRDGDQIKREIFGYKLSDNLAPVDAEDLAGMEDALTSEAASLRKLANV
ncbi:hypothetical protein [Tateyamaria sp.]|uniref:hypothetical protein n=1 Tax=Tateyamaria sp. TaxID=1929288 RepID=UPI00329F6477